MASPDKPMPGDPYLSWEHLLDEDELEEAAEAAPGSGLDAPHGLPADFALPPNIQALTRERERLEKELKQLTGAAEPDPEDERLARMFPVKVHTKETRIEERRLRQRDELLRMLEKRVMEQRRIAARMEQRREQLRAQLRQNTLEEQRLRERWARERREALAQAARERALEAAWHVRREALRQFRSERRPRDEAPPERIKPDAAPEALMSTEVDEERREVGLQRIWARTAEQRALEEARERQRQAAFGRAAQRREAERQEAARREAARQEVERREAVRREAERREAQRCEAERREIERREAKRRVAERQDALRTHEGERELQLDKRREDRLQQKRSGRAARL